MGRLAESETTVLLCDTFLEIPSLARLFQSPVHVQEPTLEEIWRGRKLKLQFLSSKERDFEISLILLRGVGGGEISRIKFLVHLYHY